jgi:hypothetical protein
MEEFSRIVDEEEERTNKSQTKRKNASCKIWEQMVPLEIAHFALRRFLPLEPLTRAMKEKSMQWFAVAHYIVAQIDLSRTKNVFFTFAIRVFDQLRKNILRIFSTLISCLLNVISCLLQGLRHKQSMKVMLCQLILGSKSCCKLKWPPLTFLTSPTSPGSSPIASALSFRRKVNTSFRKVHSRRE